MDSKLNNRYTVVAYRNALALRDLTEIGTEEWKYATENIDEILENGVKNGDRRLAIEVISILDSLYSCLENTIDSHTGEIDMDAQDEINVEINYYTALLNENGFARLLAISALPIDEDF